MRSSLTNLQCRCGGRSSGRYATKVCRNSFLVRHMSLCFHPHVDNLWTVVEMFWLSISKYNFIFPCTDSQLAAGWLRRVEPEARPSLLPPLISLSAPFRLSSPSIAARVEDFLFDWAIKFETQYYCFVKVFYTEDLMIFFIGSKRYTKTVHRIRLLMVMKIFSRTKSCRISRVWYHGGLRRSPWVWTTALSLAVFLITGEVCGRKHGNA